MCVCVCVCVDAGVLIPEVSIDYNLIIPPLSENYWT